MSLTLRHSVQSGLDAAGASLVCCVDLALNADATLCAAALSNLSVKIYDSVALRPVSSFVLPSRSGVLRGVQFSELDPALLFAAAGSDDWDQQTMATGRSASVSCFDSRSGRAETTWQLDSLAATSGQLGAFAVSASSSLLAVGLGSSIGFCDMRAASGSKSHAPRTMGVFQESHSDTINCLQFHPTLREHVLSGGGDGLVCIFDTRIAGEADAIVSVLSAGSSVERIGVFAAHGAFAHVLTRTGGVSLWNIGSAEQLASFPSFVDDMRMADFAGGVDYLVACHYDTRRDSLSLYAGSHEGAIHKFDVTPRSITFASTLPRAHTCEVRGASWVALGETGGLLFTAGEDGRICQWADASAMEAVGPARGGGGAIKRQSGILRREMAYCSDITGAKEADYFGRTQAPSEN